ncbi:hypothetical protein TNCV_1735931 [Trichonephila clavipes]|nr:hypothetical protein TNCV_1735931 [Trichonephila clavipes]
MKLVIGLKKLLRDLAMQINLEMDSDEVQKLLDSRNQKLTTDELIEMQEKDIEELGSLLTSSIRRSNDGCAALYGWIPIIADNFDAQFPPQREAPELWRCKTILRILILPIEPKNLVLTEKTTWWHCCIYCLAHHCRYAPLCYSVMEERITVTKRTIHATPDVILLSVLILVMLQHAHCLAP